MYQELSQNQLMEMIRSDKPVDKVLFDQLYQRTKQQYRNCTFQNFVLTYQEAMGLLQQKIIKTKDILNEQQEYFNILQSKEIYQQRQTGGQPLRLTIQSADVLNLQVHNNFIVGSFSFVVKVENYFHHETDRKPSYGLKYNINIGTLIEDAGDVICITLKSDSSLSLQKSVIMIPIYSLHFGKSISEVFSQKTDNELLEVELRYIVEVLDGYQVNQQIDNLKRIQQSYITKYEHELHDYELQMNSLRALDLSKQQEQHNSFEISYELTNQQQFPRQEPSLHTYAIGVPDYYNKPLYIVTEPQDQYPYRLPIQPIQQTPIIQDTYNYFLMKVITVALILTMFIGISINTNLDAAILSLSLMSYIHSKRASIYIAGLLALSCPFDAGMCYMNLSNWMQTQDQLFYYRIMGMLLLMGLQLLKLFIVCQMCLQKYEQ